MSRSADKVGAAKRLCSAYWGPTHQGGDEQADTLKALRGLKLGKSDVEELRDWLPLNATGPTGDRIKNLDSFFARL